MKIAVAGTGYVGLSNAILLSQHNTVFALDLLPQKVEQINRRQSPIADREIEDYLAHHQLDLKATTDPAEAFSGAEYVIISTPTDYDPEQNHFNTSSVESVIAQVMELAPQAVVVIKSTVPVGFTKAMREKTGARLLFSPEFLREGRALYDNLYPSRIVVGAPQEDEELCQAAHRFGQLLAQGALK